MWPISDLKKYTMTGEKTMTLKRKWLGNHTYLCGALH